MSYTGIICVLAVWKGLFKAMMTILGPNDMIHIIWAIGKYFLIIICGFFFLFITSVIYKL